MLKLEMVKVVVPVLVTWISWGLLANSTDWLPKFSEVGATENDVEALTTGEKLAHRKQTRSDKRKWLKLLLVPPIDNASAGLLTLL